MSVVFTDLCSSSSSSVDIIICKWWDLDFPGMYFKESFDSILSDETELTHGLKINTKCIQHKYE